MEQTLAIIKPDAVERELVPEILSRIQSARLRIVAMRTLQLTREEAAGFYLVHRSEDFYDSLCTYMSSGPVVVIVLEGKDAITRWRRLMGSTNPPEAEEGTIRRELGLSIERNATHGSDRPGTAISEIGYFFSGLELLRLSSSE